VHAPLLVQPEPWTRPVLPPPAPEVDAAFEPAFEPVDPPAPLAVDPSVPVLDPPWPDEVDEPCVVTISREMLEHARGVEATVTTSEPKRTKDRMVAPA
jgi:hypothetical protein